MNLYRAQLWASNGYTSCNLPSLDDADSSDERDATAAEVADDDDEDAKEKGIHYVIGDVMLPQNIQDKDAVIVHCVG